MANTYTLVNARDAVFSRMRETKSAILPTANVNQWINDIHSQVLKERHYRFMDEVEPFDTSVDTTLDGDIASGDTTIDLSDSTGLPSSGIIVIDDDVIAYTSNASNTLSGVTGIGSTHKSGARVQRIYSISSDLSITNFDKPIYISINGQEILYYDGRGGLDDRKYKIDEDNNLHIPFNQEARRVVFKYKKLVTTLSSDTDTFLIPDDYITLVVEYAISVAKQDLGYSQSDIDAHRSSFISIKRRMKNDFGHQTENRNQRIETIYQPKHVRT